MRRALLSGFLLAVAACGSPTDTTPQLMGTTLGPRLTLGATVGTDSTGAPIVRLHFINPTAAVDTVTYGACSFGIRLFRPNESGPVWANDTVARYCIMSLAIRAVAPNDTVTVTAGRIDPPALPGRSFDAAATLVANGTFTVVRAGPVTLVNR